MDFRLIKNEDGTNHLKFISAGPTTATVGNWPLDKKIDVPVHIRIEYQGEHYLFAWGASRSDDLNSYILKVSFPGPKIYNSTDYQNFLKNPNAGYESEEDAINAFMHELVTRTAIGLAEEASNRIIASKIANRIVQKKSTTSTTNEQASAVNNGNNEATTANNVANQTVTYEGEQYEVNAIVPYKRPNNATTEAQRKAVNQPNAKCATCGTTQGPFVADHKTPLAIEHITTGTVDKKKMRSLNATQPQCNSCSLDQSVKVRAASKAANKIIKDKKS